MQLAPRTISPRTIAVLGLVGIALTYACFGPIARELAKELATFQQTYVRVVVALVLTKLLFPTSVTLSALRRLSRRDWKILTLRAFMGYPLGVGCYVIATSMTKIAHVAFICALPLTAVWAMILFRERPRAVQVLGLLLSVVGLFTISLRDSSDLLSWGTGELYALASAVGFSFALVSRRFHDAGCDNKLLSSGFNLMGFLWLFCFSIANGEPLTFSPELQTIVILMFAGLTVALLTVAQSYVFTNVSGFLAGSVLSLESVFALILGWLLYQELPTSRHLMGGAIILLGAILTVWSQRTSSS